MHRPGERPGRGFRPRGSDLTPEQHRLIAVQHLIERRAQVARRLLRLVRGVLLLADLLPGRVLRGAVGLLLWGRADHPAGIGQGVGDHQPIVLRRQPQVHPVQRPFDLLGRWCRTGQIHPGQQQIEFRQSAHWPAAPIRGEEEFRLGERSVSQGRTRDRAAVLPHEE